MEITAILKKSFDYSASRVMVSALGVTTGKAATLSYAFEEGSSCVFVTNPPAWEELGAPFAILSPFQTLKQEFC